jgi:PAS domain-containing protein
VHPDDHALVQQVIERAASAQQDFDLEHRLLPDGSVKHFHLIAHAVKDHPDKHVQFVGALMDITARKQAEEALRTNEQQYRHLFHNMPVALWRVDTRGLTELLKSLRAEGVTDLGAYLEQHPDFLQRAMDAARITEVNERAVHMFGTRDVSELTQSCARRWRESPGTFRPILETRFRGEQTFQEETKVVTLDGRVIECS